MAVEPFRRRFTVDDYYRMADAGILTREDRVELIEGEILEMSPIGSRHAMCVDTLHELFVLRFSDVALVRGQNPIRLNDYSEPEPDLALLRPRADRYASGHPTAEDVFLVAEVADSSIHYDRHTKVPLYARNGIPECWLVDLTRNLIVAHRDPTPRGYRTTLTVGPGEMLAPLAFPDCPLPVSEILGEA
jgi:Uma2 family endonuclease